MRAANRVALALLGAVLGLAPEVHASDRIAEIARGIGKAAQKAGVSKVQILPFSAGSGEGTPEGRMVASKIMSALIEQGRVLVVEGDLPAGIPDPYGHALGRRRLVRPEAEAVVLGTHVNSGRNIHVDVKLLRLKDRVVLYSANKKVKNEWEAQLALEEPRPFAPEPREEVVVAAAPAVPVEREPEELDLTKAAWEKEEVEDCRAAAEEVDRLQSSIMDIKARYVAQKLRANGTRMAGEQSTLIQNGLLRDQFNMTVQQYLDGSIPPLSKREVKTLLVVDGKSFEIHRRCLQRS
ncbi:MAG: hypothetical protein HY925_11570 [Elusimicrobia bacterium]|nr:hypothetical protein [Elusimicrobiota bacterium]